MGKLNCWEFMGCGREQGGLHTFSHGLCPAAAAWVVDGFNGGRNGGRICWSIAGSFCSSPQGDFARKITSCMECDFFHTVMNEELKTVGVS